MTVVRFPRKGRTRVADGLIVLVLVFIVLLMFALRAMAQQTGAVSSCSQTVGASAAPVTFPAAGATGPNVPRVYLEICNAHASNTLGINWTNGTASIGAAGTLTLNPGGCKWWSETVIPASVSVIGSAGGTVTACGYQ